MKPMVERSRAWSRALLGRLFRSRRGSISPVMALSLIPLLAVMGLAAEASSWFYTKRSMQNAADAAALAVAQSGCTAVATSGSTIGCQPQAQAVAARFNFVDGASNVTVTSTANTQTCPSPLTTSNCYTVTITQKVPFFLVKAIGLSGTGGTVNGVKTENIAAAAMSSPAAAMGYCIIALGNGVAAGGNDFTIHGGPQMDLTNCAVYAGDSLTCTGQSGNYIGDVVYGGTSAGGCGLQSHVGSVTDPYSTILSGNPPSCTPIPQTNGAYVLDSTSANPLVNGNWTNYTCVSVPSTLTLKNNVNLQTNLGTNTSGTVLEIGGGGNLNTNGFTLSQTNGAANSNGVTVVFTGTAGGSAGFVTGGGTVNWAGPLTGAWGGVALYQDPAMSTQTNVTYSGNSPTFDLTGLIYSPYMNLTLNGAINHQLNGTACIGLVVNTLLSNGTSALLQHPANQAATVDCPQADLTLPTTNFGRAVLVQ